MSRETQEKEKQEMILVEGDHLLDQVVSILEQARGNSGIELPENESA